MKKIPKIIAFVFAGLVLLVAAALLFTQTAMFKGMVRDRVVGTLNDMLDAQFSIGGITGNLFQHIELHDVRLIRRDDTVAYIQLMAIDYKLPDLLRDHIQVDSLLIDSMTALVRQYQDSSWNIAGLFKQDTTIVQDTTEGSPFGYTISVEHFVLQNSRAQIVAIDTTIPRRIDDLVLRFSAEYGEEAQRFELQELQFATTDPDIRLERLGFVATRTGDSVSLSGFVLETQQNRLEAAGTFDPGDTTAPREVTMKMETAPLVMSEFGQYLPDITLRISPEVELDGSMIKDTVRANIRLGADNQIASFDIVAYPFSALAGSQAMQQLHYRVLGELSNINVAQWTGDTTFAYELNGRFTIAGRGVQPENAVATFEGDMSDCLVMGRRLEQAFWDFDYDKGNATGTMRFAGPFGDIDFTAFTINVLETQKYTANFSTRNLNLSLLMNRDNMTSDLNLLVEADGAGFSADKARGQARVEIDQSQFADFSVDTGFFGLTFTPEQYRFDTAFINSQYGTLSLDGALAKNQDVELAYVARIDDLNRLREFMENTALSGAVILEGTASGWLDSLVTDGTFRAAKIRYDTIAVDSLAGEYSVTIVDTLLTGNANISIDNVAYAGYFIDTAMVRAEFNGDQPYVIAADFEYSDSLKGQVETAISVGESPVIELRTVQIDVFGNQWNLGSSPATIRMMEDTYQIDSLVLTSGEEGGQRISVDGRFSMEGQENLSVEIVSLDISSIAQIMAMERPIDGKLSGRLQLTGTASRPLFEGTLTIQEGTVNRWTYDSLGTTFGYDGQRLTLDGQLVVEPNAIVVMEGFLPMNISLTDSVANVVDRSRPISLRVTVDSIPLTILQAWAEEIQVTQGGQAVGEFTVGGTLNAPDMSGKLFLRDGAVSSERLGVEYTNIGMALTFDNNAIVLDSLKIYHGDGFMRVNGDLQFSGDIVEGEISSVDFEWQSDGFWLARHENFQVNLSGKAGLQGSTTSPQFSGDITVHRSRMFIPLLTDEAMQSFEPVTEPPLLIQALPNSRFATDTLVQLPDSLDEESAEESIDLYKNLRGSMQLTMPRNTWLVGPDMNIEIGGDLELVKNSPEAFEIFGTINIVRGTYSLFGRRFEISEGILSFTGGEDVDPDIDMTATYTFRDTEREKRVLEVHATGRAFNPTLQFVLDESPVPERDAISYVVFGRRMEDVAGPGGGGGGFEGRDFAEAAAANALAGQLAQTLGKRFALDVIEIRAAGGFEGATVTVGEYITNDLFLSYQRGLGQGTDQELNPSMVTLEYELTKWLALQLTEGDAETSGADAVLNFEIE